MFGLVKLANIIEKHASILDVQPNICTRVISPLSGCTRCIDQCPANSIHITNKEIEISDCIECGICTTVCPTGALTWNKPSLQQLYEQIQHAAKKQQATYIHCSKVLFPRKTANHMEVPCLGAIPWELWLSILRHNEKLQVFVHEDDCKNCDFATGCHVWQEGVALAENAVNKKLQIVDELTTVKQAAPYDIDRRQFFYSVFQGIKATNRTAVKEWLQVGRSQGPLDKHSREQDEPSLLYQIEEAKEIFVEKMVGDTFQAPLKKRQILLQELQQNRSLRERLMINIPVINEECNVCGACSILCPTNALIQEENKLKVKPLQCVDCKLCEEICWEKHIKIMNLPLTKNDELLVHHS
ncbi:4Fe-4S binding protein [Bacillus sp. DTU_2020_1000418_1_SI_GHA_SEK_038]|uniref:indolepyruvate ferredoxin oxidoreductase subunit alpha n=1 Tax=Bacillus sp. DTU_2020_1000418_1_SI_GHA_SEK_038 TaxID=3077585 RepID=UPI0028E7DC11|nr:4Fe-4S binding protein [Bacillus sp. DTU_2020_1000418_1_SI_GHA_SEK_038]WNS74070.1 4Fe-4S binding protein [Bacillus sp. DTU_2020_1000418_1_SI_GHA_SEK_038]